MKAGGGDVRIVYSPLDAVEIARQNPDREVVFFAVGFETTAPANAMAVFQAAQSEVPNFSMLVSHVLVPPAMEAILGAEAAACRRSWPPATSARSWASPSTSRWPQKYHVPIVVTGFEPLDILQGVYMCVKQLEEGRAEVENQYTRAVRRDGNLPAQQLVQRGVRGGAAQVARRRRDSRERPGPAPALPPLRRRAALRRGRSADRGAGGVHERADPAGPHEAARVPGLRHRCTPEHPLGATMVSSEGACAAYYRYRRVRIESPGGKGLSVMATVIPGASLPASHQPARPTC